MEFIKLGKDSFENRLKLNGWWMEDRIAEDPLTSETKCSILAITHKGN